MTSKFRWVSRAYLYRAATSPDAPIRLWGAVVALASVCCPYSGLADERPIQLVVDRNQTILAQTAEVVGGYIEITLPLGGNHKLRLPIERIACGDNCPKQVAEVTEAANVLSLPKNARGFTVAGSNTIGADLFPEIVKDYLDQKQASPNLGPVDNDTKVRQIEFVAPTGKSTIEVTSKGSTTGFEPLKNRQTTIWMASRSAKPEEIKQIKASGPDLTTPASEHVIALDGLAVVVHQSNPVGALTIEEIGKIFSGEISDWSQVGGANGPIKVFRRDDNSGTTSTFKDFIMDPTGKQFSPFAQQFQENDALEREIIKTKAAIGYIGYGSTKSLKPLAVKTKCGMAFKPDEFTIKTEEYPLSRRLYLYTLGKPDNELADAIIQHATGDRGQQAVKKFGFIELRMNEGLPFEQQGARLANMLEVGDKDPSSTKKFLTDVRFTKRLSVTFRFQPGSLEIDTKGQKDLLILADALKAGRIEKEFLLLGFSDDQDGGKEKALEVSDKRARAAAAALQQALNEHPQRDPVITVYEQNIRAYGVSAPVACNTDDRGRSLNRRVEVWVR